MNLAISRTEFLRGDLRKRTHPIRPPWALPEMTFRSTCNSCGDCLEACPTGIIEFGRGQIPQINFSNGECLFCGDCLDSCKPQALQKSIDNISPWLIKADIDAETCLAFKSVECRSCEDNCEPRAIRFLSVVGSVSRPTLDNSICTGCGACFSVCPVSAIRMNSYSPKPEEINA